MTMKERIIFWDKEKIIKSGAPINVMSDLIVRLLYVTRSGKLHESAFNVLQLVM